jgi:TPR repeat protein
MNAEKYNHSDSMHLYASCLKTGTGCDKNEELACQIYKRNWDENKNIYSLDLYASCLRETNDPEKQKQAFELYKMGWLTYKNRLCMHNYGVCLYNGIGCDVDYKQVFQIFKNDWEQTKNHNSGEIYAHCLRYGLGCEKDITLSKQIYSEMGIGCIDVTCISLQELEELINQTENNQQ